MAWLRLTNSTTADADDVHGNFREVRSGSLLPMLLSTTASTTDAAYDIGSVTKRWKTGFFSGTVTSLDVERIFYTAQTTTVTGTSFSIDVNLPTTGAYEYRIHGNFAVEGTITAAMQMLLGVNGVSTGAYRTLLHDVRTGGLIFSDTTQTSFHAFDETISTLYNIKFDIRVMLNAHSTGCYLRSTCFGVDANPAILHISNQDGAGYFYGTATSIKITLQNISYMDSIKVNASYIPS